MNRFWLGVMMVCFLVGISKSANATPPPWVRRAVVRVDAYEHKTLGVAVGDGSSVLVPFHAIEVDHPGPVTVIDIEGRKLDAWVVATDRVTSLALLQTAKPIGVALDVSEHPLLAPGLFAATKVDESSIEWTTFATSDSVHRIPGGSPIVDDNGALVGVIGMDDLGPLAWPKTLIDAGTGMRHLASPDSAPVRRQFVFYGGGAMLLDFAVGGGVWWGGSFSLGARWRDLIDARVDNELSFLIPSEQHSQCVEPPCFVGGRAVITPSLGPRITLGGPHAMAFAVTPSLGYAFGFQTASQGGGGSTYDANTPAVWSRIAPGMAFSWGPAEVRVRARFGHSTDPSAAPQLEVAILGVYF